MALEAAQICDRAPALVAAQARDRAWRLHVDVLLFAEYHFYEELLSVHFVNCGCHDVEPARVAPARWAVAFIAAEPERRANRTIVDAEDPFNLAHVVIRSEPDMRAWKRAGRVVYLLKKLVGDCISRAGVRGHRLLLWQMGAAPRAYD